MKNFSNVYIAGLLVAIFFFGCEKTSVEEVDFDAALQQGTYKVGDSVRFDLSGNADIITFYSGKAGNNHDAIATQVLANKVIFSFDSRMNNAGQADQLKILTSTNYSGANSVDALHAASWQDITNKFTLSGVSTAFSPSGNVDITSMVKNNQPFYIAVKYEVKPLVEAGPWSKWELNNFAFRIVNEREEKTALDLNLSTSWVALLSANYETFRVTNDASGLVFQGNVTNLAEGHEAWLVSKVTYPAIATNYAPDYGVAIKNIPQPPRVNYATAYDTPGTYQVVFVAKNIKGDKIKEVIKKLTVKIEP